MVAWSKDKGEIFCLISGDESGFSAFIKTASTAVLPGVTFRPASFNMTCGESSIISNYLLNSSIKIH